MGTKWTYVGQCVVPLTVDAHIVTAWQTDLKAQQSRIYDALTTKITDSTTFLNKIAVPSSARFTAFLATVGAGWDKAQIVMKQQAKLGASYTEWAAGVSSVFGSKGTFGAMVDAKVGKIQNLKRTLAVVGQKSFSKWGAAANAVLMFRGDTRPATYMTAPDTFTGTLEAGFDATLGALLSPSIIAELVSGAVMAQYAHEAGLTTLRDDIITATNLVIVDLMAAAVDGTHGASTLILSWNAGATPQRAAITAVCAT